MTPLRSSNRSERERQQTARDQLLDMILSKARDDDRVLAVLDYGSTSEGRGDAWSDIDVAISIRPDAWDDFNAHWRPWLEACGPVLLGFISFVGHPWAVIDTNAAPVRVDLHLYGGPPEDSLQSAMEQWPNSPTSVEAMLLFDRAGALSDDVARMVGRTLAPHDFAETFTDVSAHFWYFVHRTWSKLHRTSDWDVRWNITFMLTGKLCALLRLEAGSTQRWTAYEAASGSGIEQAVSADRLARLNQCIPGPGSDTLLPAFRNLVDLGAEVCDATARRHNVPWPEELAAWMDTLLQTSPDAEAAKP